jgi:hypothetical protein
LTNVPTCAALENDMRFSRSCSTPLVLQARRGALIALVSLAAVSCSDATSPSTVGKDGGRTDGRPADPLSADARAAADTEPAADLRNDGSRGAETQAVDDARVAPESGDGAPEAGRKADALADVLRGPDGEADADLRRDAGTDAEADTGVRRDAGGDVDSRSDVQSPGDSGRADADADPSVGPDADPCAGGTTYADSTSTKATLNSYGWVRLPVGASNKIVAFDTTMVVPETPPPSGTLFLWPGLQPVSGGANYATLDNGVLQPVLTWGPTCAPHSPAQSYKSWWISGQYVNTYIPSSSPNYQAYHDCHGGTGMSVAVGDTLDMRFALDGNDWTQTVTNRSNGQSVSYTLDMLGQAQGAAEFVIEEYDSKPLGDVIFTSSVITFASAAKSACRDLQRGTNDYFSAPRASADGLRCCIAKVTLRAEGVAATTPNSP